ncbi:MULTISPECIES: hypothetical protein [Aequorivita]|uniref:Lipoprotein n=2 Tax=Aequorivita TaxID=153265 RepID=A0AB35YYG3_9FLAO|nr:hypothetical protein [Aequorivita sp. Ant34-E75]WGF92904.1 hypothetical protein QCQ61_01620 [Aequorivita sp. Ant34-E75]
MKNIIKFLFLAFTMVSLASCSSSKANTSRPNNRGNSQVAAPVVQEYKGIIVHSTAEGDCEYVIALEDDRTVMFDPVNLLGNFKTHGMRVWFTFRSLKMPNRCDKANPISITDIRERKVKVKKPSGE